MGDLRFNGEKYEVKTCELMRFRNSISLYRKNSMKREK